MSLTPCCWVGFPEIPRKLPWNSLEVSQKFPGNFLGIPLFTPGISREF
jgi:hypothetical protein